MRLLFTILFLPLFAVSQTNNAPPVITGATSYTTSNGTVTLAHSATDDSGSVAKWRITKLKTPSTVKRNNFAVTGSSTYIGAYATTTVATNSTKDSSMMGQIKNFYKSYGRIDTIWNYARLTRELYEVMHTGYTPPSGRVSPNLSLNIDTMIRRINNHYSVNGAAAPNGTGVMMLGFPSNGYEVYRATEVDTLLSIINDTIAARGYKWFYGSAQPREAFNYAGTLNHKKIQDSMMTAFPDKVINHWDGFLNEPRFTGVEASTYTMRDDWEYGDGVHFNYGGHVQLARQNIAINPLSVLLEGEPGNITNMASPTTTINGLTAGTYYFVTAAQDNDSLWNYRVDTVVSTWNGSGPVVSAGADQTTVLPKNRVTLTGSATGSGTLTYSWTKLSGPYSTDVIESPSSATTVIKDFSLGTWVYRLTVFDGNEVSSTDDVTVTVSPRPESYPCRTGSPQTFTLALTNVSNKDIYLNYGNATLNNVRGGDTILIPTTLADTINLVSIGNVNGGFGCPVTVKASGPGKLFIRYMRIGEDTVTSHVVVDGMKDGITQSIVLVGRAVNQTRLGASIATRWTHHITIKNLEIKGGETGVNTNNHPYSIAESFPNFPYTGVTIWGNYVHDINGEGMYSGNTSALTDACNGCVPGGIPNRQDTVEIAYNVVDSCGWDAIQLASAGRGAKIHHNTISNYGTKNNGDHKIGILLGGHSEGDVYSNRVQNGLGEGLLINGYGNINVYDNDFINNSTFAGTAVIYGKDFPVAPYGARHPERNINIYNNRFNYNGTYGLIYLQEDATTKGDASYTFTGNTVCAPNLTQTSFFTNTTNFRLPASGTNAANTAGSLQVVSGNVLSCVTGKKYLTIGGKYLVGPDGKRIVIIQ